MYFADLTPYEYGRETRRKGMLNVGWLSKSHDFPTGPVSSEFVNALRRLVTSPVNLYRGYHYCEFCPGPAVTLGSGNVDLIDVQTKGNGEIRVTDSIGNTYVAPVLICHYVEMHRYRPPEIFVHAVLVSQSRASA
jgi:hypothetical protein